MPVTRAAWLCWARWAAVFAVAFAALACKPAIRRFDRASIAESLAKGTHAALIIGEFPLAKVTDGDTIKVVGLDASLRLLGLDTEETFKYKKDFREFDKGWERYLADAMAASKSPVKIPTPMGEEAKKFADEFFKDVRLVRLERDHPKEIRDFYERYLTYVFVEKDGKLVNYNVECVRAGMSPYFSKYGYSRRFHDEFVKAQDEARAAKRGIWDPTKQHYPDYDRRLQWWNRRADFIKEFEAEADKHDNWVILTQWDALDRLRSKLGREVVILGAVGDIRQTKGPTKVLLSRRRTMSLPLIFFDPQVLHESGAAEARGEYVRVHGVVAKYFNKYKKQDELQIVVTLPGQIEREPLAAGEAPIVDPEDAPESDDAAPEAPPPGSTLDAPPTPTVPTRAPTPAPAPAPAPPPEPVPEDSTVPTGPEDQPPQPADAAPPAEPAPTP